MKKLLLVSLFMLDIVFAKTILVAAAGNTVYTLPALKQEFKKLYPKINVKFIISSSGKLTSQIENGAPFDVFLSANMKYPNYLYSKHLAVTKPKIYAKGALVVFSIRKKFTSLNDLQNLDTIAVANVKTAPYGKAAIEVLKNAKLYEKVKDKLVYAETVNQVISYVKNAADAGFVAKSSMFSPKMKQYRNKWIDIDKSLYSPINQGIVIIKDSLEARKFYNFIFSKKAKLIFKKYGYE
jgi:molybdate transport system substrate-binding protein